MLTANVDRAPTTGTRSWRRIGAADGRSPPTVRQQWRKNAPKAAQILPWAGLGELGAVTRSV
eukprot:11395337-Alexandrium_andersonii.AAC.1